MSEKSMSRSFLYIGLPIAVVAASAMIAGAYDTSWIASGQTLSATKLKGDLDEAQSRIVTLENALPTRGYQKMFSAANTAGSSSTSTTFADAGFGTFSWTPPAVKTYLLHVTVQGVFVNPLTGNPPDAESFQVTVGSTTFAPANAVIFWYSGQANTRKDVSFDVEVPASAWSTPPTATNITLQWKVTSNLTTMKADATSNVVIVISG